MAGFYLSATTFSDHGGWITDTQSMETLHSAYLMAHGIGTPVADAVTAIRIADTGTYHIYAYTRDWTKVWGRGTPAGRFQLAINGNPLPCELGTASEEWAWQKAGEISLSAGEHTIALHDLTGFNGRCAGIFFTDDPQEIPRMTEPDIVDDPEEYDLIVCGGGFAGTCTAIGAVRCGLKTLLVQDRNVLGGCGSSEVRVWVGGCTQIGKYPALGRIAGLISPATGLPGMKKHKGLFEDERKEVLLKRGENLLYHEVALAVEQEKNGSISAVITKNLRTGVRTRRKAKLFSDCTGDALLARLANCQVMYGREGKDEFGEFLAPDQADHLVMGHSVLWEVEDSGRKVSFPDVDWGIEFNDANAVRRFDCCWDWECGQYRNQVREAEYIRDYGLMTIIGNWSFLKNHAKDNSAWQNLSLDWISPIGGRRESYRVRGAYIMTEKDLMTDLQHDDATASLTWSIDFHYPDPENCSKFQEGFLSCAYHQNLKTTCEVPFRCLYTKECPNLFLGGRSISASHVAFASMRVMRTLGMLGEVAALAAAICRKHDCLPHDVYQTWLEELKNAMQQGIPYQEPHAYMPSGNRHESWHFMRPVGTYANSNENVWVHINDTTGRYKDGTPQALIDCIRESPHPKKD